MRTVSPVDGGLRIGWPVRIPVGDTDGMSDVCFLHLTEFERIRDAHPRFHHEHTCSTLSGNDVSPWSRATSQWGRMPTDNLNRLSKYSFISVYIILVQRLTAGVANGKMSTLSRGGRVVTKSATPHWASPPSPRRTSSVPDVSFKAAGRQANVFRRECLRASGTGAGRPR